MFGKKANKPLNHIDSLIGAGTRIDGNITFSGGLRIDGQVRGNITATGDKPSTLVLSDQAVIEGKIKVSHAVINGTVVGPIHSNEYLELQAKARVSGEVCYKIMEIQLGASIEGMLLRQDDAEIDNKIVALIPSAHGD
ncbi:protein CcmA, bactofilin family [Nitrosospira sp. Nl5]|uniref:bactofilin family protein n=1 Tax=Nitrosospira sp. Nl5 TaxID=200120 RepID=UPI00088B03B0|nr:polymer-forming cytoskeletal protein [Nitrosospira sp. Nl5]SCY37586.1 protein CcmA, bactofilin family [Nitrosospira sp. Nl5]